MTLNPTKERLKEVALSWNRSFRNASAGMTSLPIDRGHGVQSPGRGQAAPAGFVRVMGRVAGHGRPGRVLPFAAGIECIHTYSLIHDDLPAMDNDDLRRGRPTSHKKFGEATAILAGDGLLTEAFTLMLGTGLPPERVVAAAAEVATAAGPRGMVGGQLLDMELTGRPSVDLENLKDMHSRKTGALIMASCLSGAILAGSGRDGMERAEAYGRNVGLAFQVVDDILDVIGDESSLGKPVGSDAAQRKSTYPALIGLEGSYAVARQCVGAALEALEGFDGDSSVFLRELSVYIVDRIN
jgi:geranylgeranyl diphosphate synthase, type II